MARPARCVPHGSSGGVGTCCAHDPCPDPARRWWPQPRSWPSPQAPPWPIPSRKATTRRLRRDRRARPVAAGGPSPSKATSEAPRSSSWRAATPRLPRTRRLTATTPRARTRSASCSPTRGPGDITVVAVVPEIRVRRHRSRHRHGRRAGHGHEAPSDLFTAITGLLLLGDRPRVPARPIGGPPHLTLESQHGTASRRTGRSPHREPHHVVRDRACPLRPNEPVLYVVGALVPLALLMAYWLWMEPRADADRLRARRFQQALEDAFELTERMTDPPRRLTPPAAPSTTGWTCRTSSRQTTSRLSSVLGKAFDEGKRYWPAWTRRRSFPVAPRRHRRLGEPDRRRVRDRTRFGRRPGLPSPEGHEPLGSFDSDWSPRSCSWSSGSAMSANGRASRPRTDIADANIGVFGTSAPTRTFQIRSAPLSCLGATRSSPSRAGDEPLRRPRMPPRCPGERSSCSAVTIRNGVKQRDSSALSGRRRRPGSDAFRRFDGSAVTLSGARVAFGPACSREDLARATVRGSTGSGPLPRVGVSIWTAVSAVARARRTRRCCRAARSRPLWALAVPASRSATRSAEGWVYTAVRSRYRRRRPASERAEVSSRRWLGPSSGAGCGLAEVDAWNVTCLVPTGSSRRSLPGSVMRVAAHQVERQP